MKASLRAGWGFSAGGLGEGTDVGILSRSCGNQEHSIEMLADNNMRGKGGREYVFWFFFYSSEMDLANISEESSCGDFKLELGDLVSSFALANAADQMCSSTCLQQNTRHLRAISQPGSTFMNHPPV